MGGLSDEIPPLCPILVAIAAKPSMILENPSHFAPIIRKFYTPATVYLTSNYEHHRLNYIARSVETSLTPSSFSPSPFIL